MGALVVSPVREAIYCGGALVHSRAADHAPFKSLEAFVPSLRSRKRDHIPFPFANDLLASAVVEAGQREYDPKFKAIKHRAALIFGESALLASLAYIPEETIFWADNSRGALRYSARYRDISRQAKNGQEWQTQIFAAIESITHKPSEAHAEYTRILDSQITDWHSAGFSHPGQEEILFQEAQQAAREKAIIPFPMDIYDQEDVARLNRICRIGDITITFANLTNLYEYGDPRTPNVVSPIIEALPLADTAAILCATTEGIDPATGLFHQRGPLYGAEQYIDRFGE